MEALVRRIADEGTVTDDGLLRVEVSGVCDVEIIETAPDGQATVDDTPDATAATDGSGDGYERFDPRSTPLGS